MTLHRRNLRALITTCAAAIALAACSTTATPRSTAPGRTAASTPNVTPGQTVAFSGDENDMPLRTPVQDRLNGDGFTVTIHGYGEAPSNETYSAPSGYEVAEVVFDFEQTDGSDANPDISFEAGGAVDSPPAVAGSDYTGQWSNGLNTLEAAVPEGAAVYFDVSADGLTQSFSFASSKRTGIEPTILYRDPSGGPQLTALVERSASFEISGPEIPWTGSSDVTVQSATLGYFSPVDPNVHPQSAGAAFLTVDATEDQPDNANSFPWASAMPSGDMTLDLPGGKVLHPDPASTYNQTNPADLLDGSYFFDVPATFTTGTLVITPRAEQVATSYSCGTCEVELAGSARFPIEFPPTPAPPISGAKPPAGGTGGRTTSTTTPRHQTTKTGAGRDPVLPLGLGIVLALLLLVGALIVARRRRGPAAVDSRCRSVPRRPALPHVPVRQLAAPRPALPPGRSSGADERAPDVHELGGTVAAEPADGADNQVVVRIIGPVEASGLRHKPRRAVLVAILCYLACHKERTHSSEELRLKLWPLGDDAEVKEAKASSFHAYASMLRSLVGPENLAKATAGGYRVSEAVVTDWERFCELVAAARSTPAEARSLLTAAVGLVRGAPFEGASSYYEWALADGLVSAIEVAVTKTAGTLARLELEAGNPEGAITAARAGLRCSPDEQLCTLWLDAAGVLGPEHLERALRDVSRLGVDAGRLRRHYEMLRSARLADPTR